MHITKSTPAINRRQATSAIGFTLGMIASPRLTFARAESARIYVGFAPGGAVDVVARAVGLGLRAADITAIVDNKAGAGGLLAAEAVLKEPADGATLFFSPLAYHTLHAQVTETKRTPPGAFTGVATVCDSEYAIAVGDAHPARTLDEFLKGAAKDKLQAAFATASAGSVMHLIGMVIGQQAKVPMTHVAYRGGAAAINDVIGGNVPAVVANVPALLPMHRAGKLRILATSGEKSDPNLPGVPTLKSLGFQDLELAEPFAFFAASATPGSVIEKMNGDIYKAAESPAVKSVLEKLLFRPLQWTPQELNARVKADYERWGRLVSSSGFKK